MNILVLEASTTSAKAMLYSSIHGAVRDKSTVYDRKEGGVGMQDADGVLESLITAGREIAGDDPVDIVCLSGIWHSLVVTDYTLTPKTKSYSWEFTGAAGAAESYRQRHGAIGFYKRTGCMPHAMYPYFQLLHLQNEGLKIAPTDKVMTQGTFIFAKLTGSVAESVSLASAGGFLNIQSLRWDRENLELAGITEANLPSLENHYYCRPIRNTFARKLGISEGTPVLITHPDGALNQVGSGALGEGIMTVSVGTSSAIRMAFDRPHIPDTPSTWCYYAPGRWLVGAGTSGSTNCLDWFAQKLQHGHYSLKELDGLAARCTGETPVFLPFLFGERCPGWNDKRRGGFEGLTGEHGVAEMYLGVLEGVLFNICQSYKLLVQSTREPGEIWVSGGIIKSKIWLQMLADMLQKQLHIADSGQASMIGAACLGMLKLEQLGSLESIRMPEKTIVFPNKDKKELYEKKFARYMCAYDLEAPH